MPLSALMVAMPPLKKRPRYMSCQRCSSRVASSPTSSGAKSSTAPTTARVCHSREASPQPTRPGSFVVTLTKTQLRSSAPTTTVETPVMRIGERPPATARLYNGALVRGGEQRALAPGDVEAARDVAVVVCRRRRPDGGRDAGQQP